jgi:hypothetical protein
MMHAPVKTSALDGYLGFISGRLRHIYRDILTTLSHDKFDQNTGSSVRHAVLNISDGSLEMVIGDPNLKVNTGHFRLSLVHYFLIYDFLILNYQVDDNVQVALIGPHRRVDRRVDR